MQVAGRLVLFGTRNVLLVRSTVEESDSTGVVLPVTVISLVVPVTELIPPAPDNTQLLELQV